MCTEKIGDYAIKPCGDGKYLVAVTNGNLGARVCTKEEVQKFKENMAKKQTTSFGGWGNYSPYEHQISASDNIIKKFGKSFDNITKLKHTEGLSGCEKLYANMHNVCAATYNPYAWVELFKKGFRV